jgi:hypothetical protein
MGPFLSANTRRLQAPKIDEEVKKKKKIDETLPTVNKPKHPKRKKQKKRRIQVTKWKDPCLRKHKNHLRWRTTQGTSSSQTSIFFGKEWLLKNNS